MQYSLEVDIGYVIFKLMFLSTEEYDQILKIFRIGVE